MSKLLPCRQILLFVVILTASFLQDCRSFVPSSCNTRCSAGRRFVSSQPMKNEVGGRRIEMVGPQKMAKNNSEVDGTGRGIVIQAFVLAICVWLFTIPTEFRRAHFCFSDSCVANRETCFDCVTSGEWVNGISEYYRNGGGVQFNFEIGEDTKAAFKN